jgi:UDP-GlcNAc:undecaprenyl-phosphate GlcNAc-1-phosphate transferase
MTSVKEFLSLLSPAQFREYFMPLLLLCGGFGASFLLTPLSIHLSYLYRIVDNPGGRKKHATPTPKGGGLALWGAFVLYMLLRREFTFFDALLLSGATLIFVVGYGDSIFPMPPLLRLGIHLFASALVVYTQDFSVFSGLIVLLWLAGCTSAYNNIDGINGLCLSLGGINFFLAFFFAPAPGWFYLLGMCAGVLLWNFPNAQTFLGDGGSTLLGFLWGTLIFHHSGMMERLDSMSPPEMVAVLCLVGGLPVFDTLCSVFRRVARRKSPFLPDRGHFHYALYDRGFSLLKVLGILLPIHAFLVFSGLFWLYSKTI